MFDIIELGLEERILTGASHCVRIDYEKLAETQCNDDSVLRVVKDDN